MLRVLAGTVAVILALGCLPSTIARLQGGTGSPYTALLAALVPLTLPVLLGSVLLACAAVRLHRWRTWTTGRRTRALVVALPLLLLAVHGGWTLPSLLPGSGASGTGSPAGAATVRVLALNLEFGQADAAQVVDVVRRERVDVLAAVELTPDAVERLRAAGLEALLPQSHLLAEAGASGSGLWSRYPLTALDPLPGTRFRTPRARLAGPAGPVDVVVAHPSPPTSPDLAVADLRVLRDAVADVRGPQLVAGDFNATRDVAPFRALLEAGLADAADEVGLAGGAWPGLTWPADATVPPVMRLDHVLVSPRHFAVTATRTVSVDGTDHRGVLAVLEARR